MGRTVPSFRPAVDRELESWKPFARALRPADREAFDAMADHARVHADAGSLANRPLLSEVLFMSAALEQEKAIQGLRAQVAALEAEVRQLRERCTGVPAKGKDFSEASTTLATPNRPVQGPRA